MERIEVRYKRLSEEDTRNAGYHKYITYTNCDNEVWVAHGRPEFKRAGSERHHTVFERVDDGEPDLLFGNLIGSFGPGCVEFDENGGAEWQSERLRDARETILEGEDLSASWNNILPNTRDLHYENWRYDALRQNSHSFVDTVLHRTGLRLPELDDNVAGEYRCPGSDNILPTGGPPRPWVLHGRSETLSAHASLSEATARRPIPSGRTRMPMTRRVRLWPTDATLMPFSLHPVRRFLCMGRVVSTG